MATEKNNYDAKIREIVFTLTSDSGGDVTETTAYNYQGVITMAAFVPASGDDTPTTGYDITLTDESGLDLLCGNGADLTTSTTYKTSADGLGTVEDSVLTITGAGMGASKKATVYIRIVQ